MIIKYIVPLLLLVCFISACTKISETEIGTGLIPPVDGVITKDTDITVYTKNFTNVDTARPSLYEDHALGYVNDPLFGTTEAAINLQLLPSIYPFTFEVSQDSLTLDSVVLSLATRGVWGDTNQDLSLHVKELESDFPFQSDSSLIKYNNTSGLPTADDVTYLGSYSYTPSKWNDTFNFKPYQDSGTNALRIRLTDEFGNRLLHTYSASAQYLSDSAFKLAFKGFQISATPMVGNALLRIGLANATSGAEPNTKLALYYRYKSRIEANGEDTAVKYLTVNANASSHLAPYTGSAHSNHIERHISSGQAGGFFPATTAVNDNFLYLQTTPGTFATITIDSASLKAIPNWIIHRAEIVMEQAPDASSMVLDNFTAPYLFMVVRNNNSAAFQNDTTKYVIPGFDSTNISTWDGLFSASSPTYLLSNYSDFGGIPFRKNNTEGTSINYYSFNLSRYIQGIVTKKNPQYTFTLYTPYKEVFRLVKNTASYARVTATPLNNAGIGRVRLYGGGNDVTNPHRMKLHIVYSVPH